MKLFALMAVAALLLASVACSKQNDVAYKDNVQKALEQADLKPVTVDEDQGKNAITLGGTLHSEEAKAKAADVAKTAASTRIIANQISVQPVGAESDAKAVASSLDDGIENNYKAALISNGLKRQNVRYKAKNGVLTLTGNVGNAKERQQAEKLAAGIPNVQQVVNQVEVKR